MSRVRIKLFAALMACALSCGAAPPLRHDPVKAVVLGDKVFTCFEVGGYAEAYVHSLSKGGPAPTRRCSICDRAPVRWHVAFGAFWVSHDWRAGWPYPPEVGGGHLQRIDLALLLKGEDIFLRDDAQFSGLTETPAANRSYVAQDDRYFLYYDFLPAGKFRARQFMATNLTSEFHHRGADFEGGKSPACEFFCYLGESRWDKKAGAWTPGSWKREWSTKAAFKEPFQALAQGDDFYFVTRSGALFRAAKPAKGSDRVLTHVWYGKKQPIRSFVTDADSGKTFLFVRPARDGGKPAFFELSSRPKLVDYDPKAVPLPPLEQPHRGILHDARILVALKKIEGKPR